MKTTHKFGCDCFECMDERIMDLQAKHMKPNLVDASGRADYAELISKPATYFYDSTLVARKPVKLMRSPAENSELLQTFPQGANVGKIYTHVVRDGQVWWEVNWFSGKHAGWVKHDKGLFDKDVAEQTSSGKEREDFKQKMADLDKNSITGKISSAASSLTDGVTGLAGGIGDFMKNFGENIKWIVLLIVIAAVAFFLIKQTH